LIGSPIDAIEAFADRTLVDAKNKWHEEFMETTEEQYQSEKQIADLSKSPTLDEAASRKLGHQRRRNQVANLGHKLAQDELRRTWADLRRDMGSRLDAGELAAKGIPAPYAPGKAEIDISPHEWRMLEIRPNKRAEAIEKGSFEVSMSASLSAEIAPNPRLFRLWPTRTFHCLKPRKGLTNKRKIRRSQSFRSRQPPRPTVF
jgi:hypothetical protein